MKNFKGWRTILFNLALVVAPPALAYLASVHWTDYLNPTWAPVVVGLIGILLRLVTNTPPGQKAIVLIIGGSLVLFIEPWVVPANAADLAHKALSFQSYPTNGCGAYYGVNALGSASPIANATPGATAIGGDIGGTIGYTCQTSPSTFWFAEAMGDFQNLNGNGAGFSMTGPAHFEERVAFGGPINQLLNVLPNLNIPAVPSLPVLPNGITAGPSNGYVYAGLNEDDVSATFGASTGRNWIVSPEVGVGMLSRLSNNVVADVWAGARLQSQEVCVGHFSCPRLSTGLVTGLAFKY
jgi:hypothetical protein